MEHHESIWIDTTEAQTFPALSADLYVDVAIVGGGIVGVMAGRFLKDMGKTVAIVEARRVGARASPATRLRKCPHCIR
jgi:ribulose 1,5-bisphosphate synthetase/thiazole synthase